MGMLARLFGQKTAVAKPQLRAFDAAAHNRLTSSWLSSTSTLDSDLRAGLDTMRSRSREMVQNNEYAVRFLSMLRANIVGPQGFRLISRVENTPGKADNLANDAIEWAWHDWCKMGVCEVGGRHSFTTSMHSAINTMGQDGEVLIRLWRGASARNKFGLAIQLLDPARLDTTLNREQTGTANAIVMGVEVDGFTRPVGYYLRKKMGGTEREWVPAADIIHAFLPMGAEQTRGIPMMHAAIRRLHDIGGYREAAIIAARIGASKMGFFSMGADADPATLPDGYGADGTPYQSAEPGEFGILPQGFNFQQFDPAYPHEQFADFLKAALKGVAAGLGVSYHGLTQDLTEVSYSSIRSGTIEERDQWRVLQDWFIGAVVERIYNEWLRLALLNNAITMPNGSALPAAKADKFARHTWQARTWEWVDPESEANATVTKIDNHLSTITTELSRQGIDLEEYLQTRQREREMFAQYGVTYPGDAPQPDQAAGRAPNTAQIGAQ